MAALVANDGFFAQGAETAPKPRRSMVKRGALLGATLFFLATLLVVLTLASNPFSGDAGVVLFINFFIWLALMAIIGVSGFLKRLFTKVFNIFSEEDPLPSKKIAYTLPAAYSAPVADTVLQPVDTSRASQPSSVTEQTTSRLNIV
ncbi:MAG TPA: hypothetical protein VFS27_10095 [Blastocatellia bacterium]|nr:hypothetical protein [Blastocatellia bacterium]